MPARAALRAKTGDDLDYEVDLIRQQRIQVDEAVTVQLRQPDIGRDPRVLDEAPAGFVEEPPEHRLCVGILREDTSARYLRDVGRLQVYLQGKPIHEPCEFDLLVVQTADELAQLLLWGDDDPVLASALHPEALHDGLKVKHLLNVACDELTHLIHDEHERAPRLTALHQLTGTLSELGGCDVRFVLDGLDPGIRHRIRLRVKAMLHAACFAEREGNLALFRGPVLRVDLLVLLLEPCELPLLLESDLQLREIEVLRISEALQE